MNDLKILLRNICFGVLVLLISCKEPTEEATTTNQNQEEKTVEESIKSEFTLTVVGNNINLLTEPNGQPFGQAQDGEVYEVFDSTLNFETIGRETDFWYQVEKMGEKVWIFGAFTSKNLNDNPQIFRAKFDGAEWGDLFYLSFSTEKNSNGKYSHLDFGDADNINNYGEYKLELEQEKYIGKTFDVTWNVKPLNVYIGEGDIETGIREVPVIVDLKLNE